MVRLSEIIYVTAGTDHDDDESGSVSVEEGQ